MEKSLLRKLRILQGVDAYPTSQPPVGQDPRETLEELLGAKRLSLAEALLKIGAEHWREGDSLVAMAHSCNEAASVIYPELESEEQTFTPGDTLRQVPLPTREGMLSVGGPGFVAAHEREEDR